MDGYGMTLEPTLVPYGVEPKYFFLLAILQCLLQGDDTIYKHRWMTPISHTNRSIVQRPPWFRAYVLLVNSLSFTQTVLTIVQGFELLNSVPPTRAAWELGDAFTMMTTIVAISVQLFLIHRCWRIFNKRILPVLPLILLILIALISGILANKELFDYHMPTLFFRYIYLRNNYKVYSVIIFLYRTRTGLREHDGVFKTIWQIINLEPGFGSPTVDHIDDLYCQWPHSKFCNLSLMINLIGQSHIRRKFERANSPELPTIFMTQTPGEISAISMTNHCVVKPGI
ncbi:hypothetical protein B0J17DRAFT_632797 [Rhizoctonia solani]|nr:hypothetical protein B0J17DRAFT_632797 [Rhizoctonia solani]